MPKTSTPTSTPSPRHSTSSARRTCVRARGCSRRSTRLCADAWVLGVAALCRTSFLSCASFLQSMRYLLNTPLQRTAPFPLPTGVIEPPVRRRFVRKAAHVQPAQSRDQFDVLVRKPEVPAVTQQRDARRCLCKLAEGLDQPVPLEPKYRLRRTNRDQDARAAGVSACPEDCLEKGFRFLNGLAAEQFRAENASVEGNPVPHRAPRRWQ